MSIRALLLFRRQLRVESLDFDSVLFFHPVHQIVGFREKKLRVSGEDFQIRINARSDVDQRHAFDAESGGNRYVIPECGKRPGQHLLGLPGFSKYLDALQIGFHSAFPLELGLTSTGSIENRNSRRRAGETPVAPPTDNCCFMGLRSAKRTTSPTTSSRGAARCGELKRFATVVRCTCSDSLVALEVMAQGVSGNNPEERSRC